MKEAQEEVAKSLLDYGNRDDKDDVKRDDGVKQ